MSGPVPVACSGYARTGRRHEGEPNSLVEEFLSTAPRPIRVRHVICIPEDDPLRGCCRESGVSCF